MSAFSVVAASLTKKLSSHLSGTAQVSVCPAHIFDRRAAPTVLAVQSVPIEEDEVCAGYTVDRLVDAKKVLDRRTSAAFRPRVERSNPHHTNRFARHDWGAATSSSEPRTRRR